MTESQSGQLKIFFSAAPVQRPVYGQFYSRIVNHLHKLGCTVVEDTTLAVLDGMVTTTYRQRVACYRQVLKWIDWADLVVMEVSFPSTLHIGHQISMALEHNKPVVALYQDDHEPCFFLGREDERLIFVAYDCSDLEDVLAEAVNDARAHLKLKFTLNMTARLIRFLGFMAHRQDVPKSVYMRSLIERDLALQVRKKVFKP